jgi:hypothetical protein
MGAGVHGGFGSTAGSSKNGISKIFTRVQYEGAVTVNGVTMDVSRKVYQRNDIDFEYVDPVSKKSNLQLMSKGRAPIGSDGYPVQLHHVLQKESGPMVEIRETTHEEYNRTLHGLGVAGASFRNDPVLSKQYANFRRQYWKWRAKRYREEQAR